MEREREIYSEELGHMIMEVQKSHDLLPTSWRPRKADIITQSKSRGLKTKEAHSISTM